MKSITLSESEFKAILDATAHTVSSDDARPALRHIQLVIAKHSITAYSTDGYRASRLTIKRDKESADEFTCYIKPVPFKQSKSGITQVVISHDERSTTTLQYETAIGEMTCRFIVTHGEFPNIAKIYAENEQHDRETGINAKYLAEAMQSLAKTNYEKNHTCIIESKPNQTQAVIFRAINDSYENAQLILPVRIL